MSRGRSRWNDFVLGLVPAVTMTTFRILLTMGLVLAGAGRHPAMAFGLGAAAIRTTVMFFEPEKFTDVRDGYQGSDAGRDATLAELKKFIIQRAARHLAPGQRITITVTDLDLAGDFEPWRGPQFDDVRIVKDLYPPRINLVFQLTDAEGRVVSQGKRELRDLGFMMKLSINHHDLLRHEKDLLEDWLRAELGPANKG
ncbi:MAG: DUF3016 domain-containing protein [Opitutus sp.]|nr:DUF3016 domain-containing protein [Opitutus sp.]